MARDVDVQPLLIYEMLDDCLSQNVSRSQPYQMLLNPRKHLIQLLVQFLEGSITGERHVDVLVEEVSEDSAAVRTCVDDV